MSCPAGPHTHGIAEVCELIGCDSEDWLIDRVRNGTFPARRVVRQLRFSDADIDAIIAACAVSPRGGEASMPQPIRTRRRAAS